jgi:hypothetical protein
MKNWILTLAFMASLTGMASGRETTDTLTYSRQHKDSLVFTNTGDHALRLDSIAITTLEGPGKALFFDFTFGDTAYIMLFGSSDSTPGPVPGGGYALFHGAEIPPHGRRVFTGRVTALPPLCPCGHAGARPITHLFGLRFFGAGLDEARLLKGEVDLDPGLAIVIPVKPPMAGKGIPKVYRIDGRAIIHSQRHPSNLDRAR